MEGIIDVERRQALLDWLETDLPVFFHGRVLAITMEVADRWSRVVAAAGRQLPAIDSLLAATALVHDLTVVTRNTRDVNGLGVSVLNPWG